MLNFLLAIAPKDSKTPQNAFVYTRQKAKNTPEDLGRVVAFLFFVSITLFLEIMSRISNCFYFFNRDLKRAMTDFVIALN